jgi:thiol:disulfide interchange protein DsbD
VRAKLKEIGAVSFIGDYTRLPEEMTAELNRYGRAGVPLVLVFPPKAGQPPIVLPELLTPGIVLDALNRAAK